MLVDENWKLKVSGVHRSCFRQLLPEGYREGVDHVRAQGERKQTSDQ